MFPITELRPDHRLDRDFTALSAFERPSFATRSRCVSSSRWVQSNLAGREGSATMSMMQEVFLETTWEDAEAARQARDDRAAQLTAQGLVCTCETLATVEGRLVFVVVATDPPMMVTTPRQTQEQTRSSDRPRCELADPNSTEAPRPTRSLRRVLPRYETK